MIATFNNFEIEMTLKQAQSVSHSGQCIHDVKYLSEDIKIKRQIKKIKPDLIRKELEEYGAWDTEELKDDFENILRILWIAGGNIIEEQYTKRSKGF